MLKNERKGFTLIEILIVVAIIAILASIVLVGLGPSQQAGRDARRLSDLREVQNGLELYYNDCGYYPGAAVAAGAACPAWTETSAWTGTPSLTTSLEGNTSLGITTVPNDPTAGKNYYYDSGNGGADYVLAAHLENLNNSVFNTYTPPNVTTLGTAKLGISCGTADTAETANTAYCISL
jgi:prepilin-type N-terminal cleavage/methylation domain-containing protein